MLILLMKSLNDTIKSSNMIIIYHIYKCVQFNLICFLVLRMISKKWNWISVKRGEKKIKYFPLYFITNDMLINHYQIANDSHLDIIIKNNYLQMGFTVAKFYSRFHFSWYHLAFFLHLKFYGKWNCFLFFFFSSYDDKWNERFNSIKPFILYTSTKMVDICVRVCRKI